MTSDAAIDLFRNAMLVAAKVAGPMLLTALIVGLIVGILQAATQVNEASISYVTKLIAMSITMLAMGSWAMTQLADYTTRTISSISTIVH